jgi:hypothetical protein
MWLQRELARLANAQRCVPPTNRRPATVPLPALRARTDWPLAAFSDRHDRATDDHFLILPSTETSENIRLFLPPLQLGRLAPCEYFWFTLSDEHCVLKMS